MAAYARVSTDKDDQANSLAGQRWYFADFIMKHEDWRLVRIYYDEGISGTSTKKRSGFNEMIEEALCGRIDLILTKEVCRFARNTVDTLSYTRMLKEAGVGVVFTIDNIDTRDSDGELRLTIMASIAQEESRKTSERVKWGQQRRMEQGVVFGRDLIGYTVKNGSLEINEEEAPIVRAVFHKYTNEGKGAGVIARELLEEGMRPKRISRWSGTVILRMVRNEKYVGDLCQKKTITPNYLTHVRKYNRGEEEMIYIHDHHQPIIDRELWERTQKELERRAVSQEKRLKHSSRYWCSGKLYCGECGQRFVGRNKKQKNGTDYRAWRCHAAAEHGAKKLDADGKQIGCSNSQVSEKALLSCMRHCVRLVPVNMDELKEEIIKAVRQEISVPVYGTDISCIRKRLDEIRKKRRRMIDLVLEGLASREDLKAQNEWYGKEKELLEGQLKNAEQKEEIRLRQTDSMEQYIGAVDEIMETGEAGGLFYRELLDKMVIYKGGRMVVWLKSVPVGIGLKFCSCGRGDGYTTEILETQLVAPS